MEPTKPAEVPTSAPTQPVQSKKSKKNLLIIVSVLLIILVPLVAVATAAGVASSNLGKNTQFSKLSAFLPTERVPLLNSLGKSDYVLLRDAIAAESDMDLVNKLSGRSQVAEFSMNMNGTDEQGRGLDASLNAKVDVAMNKASDKAKVIYTAGGSVKSGIINIDLGQEGFKSDVLMTSPKELYMSASLSDKVIDPLSLS
jgi:flagellar basal body-associated protein FliL